jgi:glycosyltransferase involved in cell wall biosynthesis
VKIAIVDQPFGRINLPWTGAGGSIDIWIYEVARRLAQSCNVIVYTKRDLMRAQKKVEYDQGVCYRRISTLFDDWYTDLQSVFQKLQRFPRINTLSRKIQSILLLHNPKRPLFASKLYYLTYALQVAKDLKKEKCDVVQIINFSQFAPIFRTLNPEIKIVLNMRCEWLTQLDPAMIKSRLREVDLICGVSEYITDKIRIRFPQFADRCQTILNGVDVNYFVNKEDNGIPKKKYIKQLLFVGRISPEKGVHVLLDAFQKVIKRYPQAHLEIIGDKKDVLDLEWFVTLGDDEKVSQIASFYNNNPEGNYFSFLQRQLLSLHIANNVTFTGFIPNLQLINHYQNADVLVNPSFSEAFGRSLIEAMACHVPVVATRVGGMTEIVDDGKTGILAEPGDASALAEAILRLLTNVSLQESMGKAGRRRAIEFYSWERIVERLLFEYEKICDGDG